MPVRIAFCITDFDDGGAERHLGGIGHSIASRQIRAGVGRSLRPAASTGRSTSATVVSDHRIPITFLDGRNIFSTPTRVAAAAAMAREFSNQNFCSVFSRMPMYLVPMRGIERAFPTSSLGFKLPSYAAVGIWRCSAAREVRRETCLRESVGCGLCGRHDAAPSREIGSHWQRHRTESLSRRGANWAGKTRCRPIPPLSTIRWPARSTKAS